MKKALFLTAVLAGLLTSGSYSQIMEQQSIESAEVNDTCRIIDEYLTQLSIDKGFSGGLLIIKGGTRIFNKGYGWANKDKKIPFTPSTLASMGSITKAFTAAAILKLSEQGKLSVNDPLSKFFPDIPDEKADITIHQLLTHSSGFHEFLKGDGGDFEKIETAEYLKRAFKEPLAFRPGEKAVYTNVGMSVLGIIIEKVSGTDYETFLQKNLLEPAGIYNMGYHVADSEDDIIAHGYQNGNDWGTISGRIASIGDQPYWNLKANGGLHASLDDMYLWVRAVNNNAVLSDSSVGKMFTAHIVEEGYGGQSFFGYGCNITKSRRGTKMIDNGGSNGIFFARLVRLPEEGVVFYIVTNESTINANMVLPNITQLYFNGRIGQDATVLKPEFKTRQAARIYNILEETKSTGLSDELEKQRITVDDDMVLLEVGRRFIEEKKTDQALSLYKFYTHRFPEIIVAWNDMGDVYQMTGNKEEAIRCYNQALKLNPGNQRAIENLKKLNE